MPEGDLSPEQAMANYTGTVPWSYLAPHCENGTLLFVDPSLALETVGVAIAEDRADEIDAWIKSGDVVKMEEIHAFQWKDSTKDFHALVVSPFVLCRPA